MSLANVKAPGFDGIPVEFYKAFWPVVGKDLLEVFLKNWTVATELQKGSHHLAPKEKRPPGTEELEAGLIALQRL